MQGEDVLLHVLRPPAPGPQEHGASVVGAAGAVVFGPGRPGAPALAGFAAAGGCALAAAVSGRADPASRSAFRWALLAAGTDLALLALLVEPERALR